MSLTQDPAGAPLFVEFKPGTRRRIAAAVDALVALLDEIDGDQEFEEDETLEDDAPSEDVGDDEPSLGALGGTYSAEWFNQGEWANSARDDREDEHDGCEPDEDGEPTLGATTAMNQGLAWRANPEAWGACDEAEPSLGWTGHGYGHPQIGRRGYGDDREQNIGADDREWDEAERGIGDLDGLIEQFGNSFNGWAE